MRFSHFFSLLLLGISCTAYSQQTTEELALASSLTDHSKCYDEIWTKAEYQTISEQVLIAEASNKLELIPAQFKTVEEFVLVTEAARKGTVYAAEKEFIIVQEETTDFKLIPAQYQNKKQQVLIKEGTDQEPAQYKTIHLLVETSPAIAQAVQQPARYQTIIKKVIQQEGNGISITPAQYQRVTKQVLVTPAQVREIAIPASYETIDQQIVVKPPQKMSIERPCTKRELRKAKRH